jgi:hypothetical protein
MAALGRREITVWHRHWPVAATWGSRRGEPRMRGRGRMFLYPATRLVEMTTWVLRDLAAGRDGCIGVTAGCTCTYCR